jgi:hypothetical protein
MLSQRDFAISKVDVDYARGDRVTDQWKILELNSMTSYILEVWHQQQRTCSGSVSNIEKDTKRTTTYHCANYFVADRKFVANSFPEDRIVVIDWDRAVNVVTQIASPWFDPTHRSLVNSRPTNPRITFICHCHAARQLLEEVARS